MLAALGGLFFGAACRSSTPASDSGPPDARQVPDSGAASDAAPADASSDAASSACDAQLSRLEDECGLTLEDDCAGPADQVAAWAACIAAADCDAIWTTYTTSSRPDPELLRCLLEDIPGTGSSSADACLLAEVQSCSAELDSCELDEACATWLACHFECQRAPAAQQECHSECDQATPGAAALYDPVYACGCEADSSCHPTFGIIGIHEGPGLIAHCE